MYVPNPAEDEERDALLIALAAHGVTGLADFGNFVNNITCFTPSTFDIRASWPVLLNWFPRLNQPRLVDAVARYLGHPSLRPQAFPVLEAGFRRWAVTDATSTPGWTIGASLAATATVAQLPQLLDLATDKRFGRSRQEIVDSLWRYRKSGLVAPVLLELIHDHEVGLHAMSALRQTIGNAAAIPHLEQVEATANGTQLGKNADKAIKRARKSLAAAAAKEASTD
ncbi:hypothetical protein D6T63_17675 [Arthrobacter cheniae]|uniref:DNA alkylation repair enzyme n=1 Tax=Arthrobacter cheniae TaxID=1258888 RepID=A0A3A5LX88_9MICC|nr:hypothetical protein [Arthrobacter cheniae]RJT75648.1 hypothetical protein D6T63_17675 [Arthrobacter cheniae]